MAGRSAQVVVEVAAGVGAGPTKGRSAQVVLELAVTIAAAPPPPPPSPVGPSIPQGGGGKFFLAEYNCFDCLLQFQQAIWDKALKCTVEPQAVMTEERKRRKKLVRPERRF